MPVVWQAFHMFFKVNSYSNPVRYYSLYFTDEETDLDKLNNTQSITAKRQVFQKEWLSLEDLNEGMKMSLIWVAAVTSYHKLGELKQ